MTVADAFHRCWAGYWDAPRFHISGWAKEVEGYYRRRIKNHGISSVSLREVTPKMVRDWHTEVGQVSTVEANRAMEVLSRIFSYAEENEFVPLGYNPCRIVKSYPEGARDRYATPDEIRRLGMVLCRYWTSHPRDTAFIFFLLLTGARPSSLERAEWKQIKQGILKLDGKTTAATGAKDQIAIPEYVAKEILSRIPKRRDGLIFGPGLPQRFWEKVKTEAGCPDLWARDLRRTFATFGLSDGVGTNVIGELLNHRSAQTTMIYAKLLPHARLVAANRIAEGIIESMKKGKY